MKLRSPFKYHEIMAKVTSEPKTTAAPQADTPNNDATATTPMSETHQIEVPAAIAAIFKAYPQYSQLWIDREGGVFTSKPVGSTSAILYKKPEAPKA